MSGANVQYANKTFTKGEKITVYVGEDIGLAGSASEQKERATRVTNGGGRHIMQIGRGKSARNIDGVDGYACAQYINVGISCAGAVQ